MALSVNTVTVTVNVTVTVTVTVTVFVTVTVTVTVSYYPLHRLTKQSNKALKYAPAQNSRSRSQYYFVTV